MIAGDAAPCWILGDVASLGNSGLWEAVRDNERLLVVLAGSGYNLERLHRADRITEPIVVIFHIDLAALDKVHTRFELFVLGLFHDIEEAVDFVRGHLWHLVLVRVGLCVRVVQIDRDDFLGDRVLESTCSLVDVSFSEVKTIIDVVVARSCLFCPLIQQFTRDHGTFLLGDEGARATVLRTFDWTGAVLAYTWIRLLEVDVNSDGFHVVQRIFLVEWQTEVALILHLGSSDVLLDRVWLVLAWADINPWIIC